MFGSENGRAHSNLKNLKNETEAASASNTNRPASIMEKLRVQMQSRITATQASSSERPSAPTESDPSASSDVSGSTTVPHLTSSRPSTPSHTGTLSHAATNPMTPGSPLTDGDIEMTLTPVTNKRPIPPPVAATTKRQGKKRAADPDQEPAPARTSSRPKRGRK